MEHKDSSSALALLQYGEDSDEESSFNEPESVEAGEGKSLGEKKRRPSARLGEEAAGSPSRRISEDSVGGHVGALISDDEDHHDRKRDHPSPAADRAELPLKMTLMDVSKKMAPAVSPLSSHASPASLTDSTASKPKKTKITSLVSYARDDIDDDDDHSSEESSEEENENSKDNVPHGTMLGSRGMDGSDIQLPPEPPGRCPKNVQDKISDLYQKMREQGFNPNNTIQRLTSFRNPSIYEKLIQLHHIDEKGSNFPLDVYNPNMWSKQSFYDELDKAQKKDMERREKERKTKVEFVSGTKKSSSSSSNSTDADKRKSKWDALPPGISQHQRGSGSSANLTSSATGTRATVISAVGTLSKKGISVINTSSSSSSK